MHPVFTVLTPHDASAQRSLHHSRGDGRSYRLRWLLHPKLWWASTWQQSVQKGGKSEWIGTHSSCSPTNRRVTLDGPSTSARVVHYDDLE